MSMFRRFNFRLWDRIPRFSSGGVNGAESFLIDWQSRTGTRNTRPFMGYGDSLLVHKNLSAIYLMIKMDLIHTNKAFFRPFQWYRYPVSDSINVW